MTKDKYQWGRIVEATKLAQEQLGIKRGTKAMCLGRYPASDSSIRVLRLGYATEQNYHVDFWKPTKARITF